MEAVGGMDRYFQFKAAQALGNIGAGGGGAAGGGGTDIGRRCGGLGLGAGAGLGMMLPGMLQQAMASGAQPKMRCPNCSSDIPADSKFCPNCGHNLQATITAPNAIPRFRPLPSSAPTAVSNWELPQRHQPPLLSLRRGRAKRRLRGTGVATQTSTVSNRVGAAGGRRLVLALLLVTIASLLTLVPAASAQAKSWSIDSMDVVLDIDKNGSLLVEETVTFRFEGSFSYVGRVIPTANLESLSDIEVLQDGRVLPRGDGPGTWDVFNEGDSKVIQVNFALTDASATWVFRYRALGSILYFDEGDELRWYLFDADTPVPIESVRATVRLPEPVPKEEMTMALNTGPTVDREYGAPEPGVAVFQAGVVPPYTNYWIVVGFPKGVVTYQWTVRRVLAAVVPRLGFALPILVFLGMLLTWRKRGRDDPAGAHAKYVAEPPSDLPPGLAGALIDEEANVTEVTATIVDLARRGYIEMVEDKEGGLFAKSVVTFRKLKPLIWQDLSIRWQRPIQRQQGCRDHQRTEEPLLHACAAHLQCHLREVASRGYFYQNPAKVRQKWRGWPLSQQ